MTFSNLQCDTFFIYFEFISLSEIFHANSVFIHMRITYVNTKMIYILEKKLYKIRTFLGDLFSQYS